MPRSLLIVDDDVPLLRAMREFFEMRGFEVDCATELEEAFALLEHRRYSLLISDVCLRGVRGSEGLEVVANVRAFSPDTRIIILTGIPQVDLGDGVSEHDVDCVLMKPQPLTELAVMVDEILGRSENANAHAS